MLAISGGCSGNSEKQVGAGAGINENLGVQIGDLVDVPELPSSPVEGYGIVAGLGENGSSECPVDVLEYLKRYTRVMMPESREDPEKLIRSLDTAVVRVTGEIKPGTKKGGRFDIKIKPIQGSQTRSLAGGQLYTMDLVPAGRTLAAATAVGMAAGPVFIDTLAAPKDNRTGYVLGGGQASTDYPITITLKKPDFKMASALRNRIIQRFGPGVATAKTEGLLVLTPPQRFEARQKEFIDLVKALYVAENDQMNMRRAEILTRRLIEGPDRMKAETSLIGLGRINAVEVMKLLSSPDEEVRFRAARVILSYKEYDSLDVLRKIMYDVKSKWRMEALSAVAAWAPSEQTSGILANLVNDRDIAVRLAAEDELVRCGSPMVARENVGGKLFLDIVNSGGPSLIYATRTGGPRIIVFGQDMTARGEIFLTAADSSLTLNSQSDSDVITIIRSRRSGTGVVAKPLESSRLVLDLIKKLSSSPIVEGEKVTLTGLNVAYSDTLEVLKLLCEKGYVKARFVAGDMGQFAE
jgi:hypothetical protein